MKLREIEASEITSCLAEMCMQANFEMGEDVEHALRQGLEDEVSPLGRDALGVLIENARLSRAERTPLCQDCGVAVVFIEAGQDVHVINGSITEAVTIGVRQGYEQGYLRKSMVRKPVGERVNTNDNTPPVLHFEIVPGGKLKIIFMPKGGGAENMSRVVMHKPGDSLDDIVETVVDTVRNAGGAPCPPLVIGLGLGGTFEKAAIMAKKALARPLDRPNPDPVMNELENEVLEKVNMLGIGPLGMGGRITALRVHASSYACHMASLPLAINLQCHSARHLEVEI